MSSIKTRWIGNKWWNSFTAFVHEMPFTSWETVVKMYKQFFQHIYTWKLNKDTYWVEDVFSFDFHCNQLTLKNMVGHNCCCCGARRASISCHLNVSFLFLDSVVFFVLRLLSLFMNDLTAHPVVHNCRRAYSMRKMMADKALVSLTSFSQSQLVFFFVILVDFVCNFAFSG